MKKLVSIIAMCLTVHVSCAERRMVGDMNSDGKISVEDLVALLNMLSHESLNYARVADINDDKKIDKEDVEKLSDIILGKATVEYYDYIDGSIVEDDPLPPEKEWD